MIVKFLQTPWKHKIDISHFLHKYEYPIRPCLLEINDQKL